MDRDRRVAAILALLGWLVASYLVLTWLQQLRPTGYFVAALLGLLVVVQLFAPVESRPTWWVRLRVTSYVAIAVYVLILIERIVTPV